MAAPKETVTWDFAVSGDFAQYYVTPAAKKSLPLTPIDPHAPIIELIIHTKGGDVPVHDTQGRVDEEAFGWVEGDLARLTDVAPHIP